MEEEMLAVPSTASIEIIEELKEMLSNEMEGWKEDLLAIPMPRRENFRTEEDYNKALQFVMISSINAVQKLKRSTFKDVLETYNSFLTEKQEWNLIINKTYPNGQEMIKTLYRRNKTMGVLMLISTLLSPSLLPIILAFYVSYLLGGKYLAGKLNDNCQNLLAAKEEINRFQRVFYDVVFDLRNDYHRSNEELDQLRERALKGENIMQELIEIINPERISLPPVQKEPVALLEEDKPKTFAKQKDN